ncbi:MAG: SH3 domain-containing protein [Anaerolineaceae bacterium]|nr:MAG: SH3 domain-containing protein [Anaerolineaceae bacterium]
MSLLALAGGLVVNAQYERTVTLRQNVNLRAAPSADAELIQTARAGMNFKIGGRTETGEWVRGILETGAVGWMVNGPTGLTTGELVEIPITRADAPFTLSPPPAAIAAPAGTAPDVAVPVAPRRAVGGFGYGGHMAGMDGGAFDWMRRAGMTWVKKQVRYSDGQSAGGYAEWINRAHENGFQILLGVVGQAGQINNPGYFERYAQFNAELAALGADAIEVWNEPNIDHEWPAGQIDPARYTEMLRLSYNAIKAANPGTMVISAAPAPTGAEGAFPGRVMNDNRFIAGMAAAGAANYMDCVGVHYNEGIVPPTARSGDPREPSDYYTRYLPAMIDVYHGAFGGRVPLCFTELGYLTPEGLGPLPGAFAWAGNVTLAQQAAWVAGAVNVAQNSRRVRMVIIWNINFTNYGADPMAGFAIIRPGNTCPACEALANR